MIKQNAEQPWKCRACQGLLIAPGAGRPLTAQCARCGYWNALDQPDEVKFPLATTLNGLVIRDGAPEVEIYAAIDRHTQLKLTQAAAIISAAPGAATAFLLTAIAERDKILSKTGLRAYEAGYTERPVFNLATQLLYLMLSEQGGGVQLSYLAKDLPEYRHLGSSLWPILTEAVMLPRVTVEAQAGYYNLSVRDAALVLAKTSVHTLLKEWQINLLETQQRAATNFSWEEAELIEAQKVLLGFSSADVFELMPARFSKLAASTVVQERNGVWVAVVEGAREPTRSILPAMTLSLDRVRRFKAPYYFDLGLSREVPLPSNLPSGAIGQNWSVYYPFYEATAANGKTPVVIFSPQILMLSVAAADWSRAHMFDRLTAVASQDAQRKYEIARLARVAFAKIESEIADVVRKAGWETRASLTALGTKPLPCGEIDVVAVRTVRNKTSLLLVEAKDIDIPLHKPGVFSQTLNTVRHGADQVKTKGAWLSAHWREVAGELGLQPGDSANLASFLVTRRYVPPQVISELPIIPFSALPKVLSRLNMGELDAFDGVGPLRVSELA